MNTDYKKKLLLLEGKKKSYIRLLYEKKNKVKKILTCLFIMSLISL